jgi:hypothetical protein
LEYLDLTMHFRVANQGLRISVASRTAQEQLKPVSELTSATLLQISGTNTAMNLWPTASHSDAPPAELFTGQKPDYLHSMRRIRWGQSILVKKPYKGHAAGIDIDEKAIWAVVVRRYRDGSGVI